MRLTVALRPTPGPLFFLDSPEATFEHAAALGFDAVDVAAASPAELRDARVADLAERSGLRVAGILTGPLRTEAGLSLSDPALAPEARARIAAIAEAAAPLGAGIVIGWLLGTVPTDADRAEREDTMIASLAEIAAHAKPLGVPVLLEPINRYESNLAPTAATAADLIARAGGGIDLILDSFHANIEESDPLATAREFAPQTGLVQLADSNRLVPGRGHFPLTPWIETIRAAGYRGDFALEALYGPDPLADLREAAAFMAGLRL